MRVRSIVLPLIVALGVASMTLLATNSPAPRSEPTLSASRVDDLSETIAEVNAALRRLWSEERAPSDIPADALPPVVPAKRADDLTVLRRLSLALHGSIPSLAEIRRFENDTRPDRLLHWTAAMLEDPRFADYFAERLGRAYVGVEDGQFLIFRRDRFTAWLSGELRRHRPYDAIVRQMVAARGVWTGAGEVNFLTAAYANEQFDPNKLTARTTRAFLGQRIDCAQCHDHPFDHWKQSEFEGLAAHYGRLSLSLAGVVDDRKQPFTVTDADGENPKEVEPAVPFHEDWLPEQGSVRGKLAAWVTHPDNRRFERAIANRVWGLMFGRPFADRMRMYAKDWETGESQWVWTDRAVDDLPDPDDARFGRQVETLDILGRDFREHGCDLRRLIMVIAASDAFRLESTHPELAAAAASELSDQELEAVRPRIEQIEARWGVFPLVRLRPEQVIGSMLQSNFVATVDRNSHLFVRAQRFFRERDFINEFGDPGVDELEDGVGTIQQALLRMNGDFANDLSKEQPFTAPGQIVNYSSTSEEVLENVFLSSLTRRPNDAERACFLPQLEDDDRKRADGAVQDLYWAIFNAPEFSWNH
jgi:hypothetical protein